MTTKEYIYENDVDINNANSLSFHLSELTSQINEKGMNKNSPIYKIVKDLYLRFKELQPF